MFSTIKLSTFKYQTMNERNSEKLEMVFAHLTINNVRDIKPLLHDAIDEYQSIRSSLTYDQKQKVNFIKTLLYHAEREEWHQARNQLNGAQRAYQEYINSKLKLSSHKQKIGYAQIHGRRHDHCESDHLALQWKDAAHTDKYMFKDESAFARGESEQESPKARKLQEEMVLSRINSPGTESQFKYGTRTPDEDEQGPEQKSSFLNRPLEDSHPTDYPGSYSDSLQIKPRSLNETLESAQKKSGTMVRRGAVEDAFDPNRPSRIADAFQSLFENQWQHAFTALKRAAVIEETALECLLYILSEAYKQCDDEARSQIIQFEHAVLNIVTDGKYTKFDRDMFGKTGDVKHMLQYRKEVSDLSVKRLQDSFLMKTLPIIHRRYGIKNDDNIDSYSRQCIVVTWRMVIQDPPLHLGFPEPDVEAEFNLSLYKPFTKAGDTIKYIVWPVLRIYKGGPVLCRGIAQGK